MWRPESIGRARGLLAYEPIAAGPAAQRGGPDCPQPAALSGPHIQVDQGRAETGFVRDLLAALSALNRVYDGGGFDSLLVRADEDDREEYRLAPSFRAGDDPDEHHRACLTTSFILAAGEAAGIGRVTLRPPFREVLRFLKALHIRARVSAEVDAGAADVLIGEHPVQPAEAYYRYLELREALLQAGGGVRILDAGPGVTDSEALQAVLSGLAAESEWEDPPSDEIAARVTATAIRSLEELPTVPAHVAEIQRRMRDSEVSVRQIAPYIQDDPVLTASILKYANSALVGLPNRVTNLQTAIGLLGPQTVVTLAFGLAMKAHRAERCPAFDHETYWSRSAARAACARALAGKLDIGGPEDAFTAGLLSEIGQLALATCYPHDYAEILGRTGGLSNAWLARAEREKFGLTHYDLAADLFEDWRLPEAFPRAVRSLDPALDDDDPRLRRDLGGLLRWARAMESAFTAPPGRPQAGAARGAERCAARLGLVGAEFGRTFDACIDDWAEAGRILDVGTRPVPRWTRLSSRESHAAARPA